MTVLTAHGVIPQFTLADRLLKARKHAGLEQKELADAIGIGRSTLVLYEQGRSTPRRHVLLAWAMATGVDSEWLFEGSGQGKESCLVADGGISVRTSWGKYVSATNYHHAALILRYETCRNVNHKTAGKRNGAHTCHIYAAAARRGRPIADW